MYRAARQQILSRVYAADHALDVGELSESLGVDASAAFYALTRLAADGLVRRDPDRGYVITPFTVPTSDDTFDARLAIELGVIESVVGQVPASDLARLRGLFETMAALLVGDRFVDFDAYLDANYAFHEGLVSLAGHSLLTTTFGSLSIKSVMTRSFGSTPVDLAEVHRGPAPSHRGDRGRGQGRRPAGRARVLRAGQGTGARDPHAHRRPSLSALTLPGFG